MLLILPALIVRGSAFKELPFKKIGRPMNIGEQIDGQVQAYIKHLRESGAPVSIAIVIAIAKGISYNGRHYSMP